MQIISNLIEAHIVRFNYNRIEYLLLKRSTDQKYPNLWQMVTGKVKENEEGYKTAIREIKEETSLKIEKIFIVPNVNSFYNSNDDSMNLIPVFVSVANSSSKVKISDEHQKYKWVNKKLAKQLLAWPGQSKSVNIIDDFFTKRKPNLNFIEIDLNKN